jgi:hypothetical protein
MEWTADTISQLVLWAFIAAACAYAWHSMRKGWRESEKINRAVDEENRRKAESQEGLAAYWEARRRERNDLKKLILGDLKLIRRGEKRALGPKAVDALFALRKQDGDHPDTLKEWEPVVEGLKGEILDANAAQRLLDDRLYPDALEDEEELTQRIVDGLNRAAGDGNRVEAEVFEAMQALGGLKRRDARKKREEWEVEANNLHREEEEGRTFRAEMVGTARDIIRDTALSLGLSANDLDHLSFDEALKQICTLQSARELAKKPVEEREKIIRELDRADSDERRKVLRELDGGLYNTLNWFRNFVDKG